MHCSGSHIGRYSANLACCVQGMNFIAGSLLLFMDEEDAFWCLAVIAEDLLPGYYDLVMVAPQARSGRMSPCRCIPNLGLP